MLDSQESRSHWDRWFEATSAIRGGFETRPSGNRDDFRGTLKKFEMLGLKYISVETNARGLFRGVDPTGSDRDHYCLVYQGRGRSVVRQARRMAVLDPGDMAVLSPYESCEFVNKGVIRQLSFQVNQQALKEALGSDGDLLCHAIRNESALGSLLSATLLQVHTRSSELTQLQGSGASLATAIISLTAAALGNDDDTAKARQGDDLISTVSVIRYIDTNLRSTSLSPANIARALGCSARHIHRAFEGTGTTAASYIREQRLSACADELRDPQYAHDSISDVAFRWGFSDISHFSRSFRSQFDMSPRAYRETRTLLQ